MAQELKADSGRRFAGDMRRIRESRHISVDDLHEETKIPIGLLEAFEDTALFDHPQFNRVYLRSFVRTYANVIDVDAEVALAALEDALSDSYAGSLAAEYLGESVEPPAGSSAEAEGADKKQRELSPGPPSVGQEEAAPASRRGGAGQPGSKQTDADVPDSPSKPREEVGGGHPPGDTRRSARPPKREDEPRRRTEGAGGEEPPRRKDRDATPGATLAGASSAGAAAGGAPGAPDEPDVDSSEWTTQSPPRPRASSRPSTHATSRQSSRAARTGGGAGPWLLAGALLIAVVGVIWFVAASTGDDPTRTPEMSPGVDTTAVAEGAAATDQAAEARAAMPTLGDTLNVQIVAANEVVDPIRVTVDDDLRRPYWIELGDSMTFRPTERIVIEEDLDAIALRIEGVEYPTTRRDDLGRIVINRDSLRAYFSTNGAE